MPTERRNQPEQEFSIKRREHELFVSADSQTGTPAAARPFKDYLRETPAAPLSTEIKAVFWVVGVIVTVLFLAALWRIHGSSRPRPRSSQERKAASTFPRPCPYPCPVRDGTMTLA